MAVLAGDGVSAIVLAWIQRCQAEVLVWVDGDYLEQVATLGRSLKTIPESRSQADRIGLSSALLRLAWNARRRLRLDAGHEAMAFGRHLARRARVNLALKLLCHHRADRELTLDGLAGTMDITASYLSRAIHAETRLTFSSIVNSTRLMDVIVLLRSTQLPIERIAEAVGYRRTCELDRQFRRWLHMTPTSFRGATRTTESIGIPADDAVASVRKRFPDASPSDIADAARIDFGVVLQCLERAE